MPLGDHAAHWANLPGEIVREFPIHFHSWHNILEERKARVLGKIRTQFNLTTHMQSDLCPKNKKGIEQQLTKIYTYNKSALNAEHWVANPDNGTYDVEGIRSRRPANISMADWDAQIDFWSDPKNAARCVQNSQNRAKSMEERLRLHGLGSNTSTGVSYTDDQIMAIVRQGKQRGHIPGVGRGLEGKGRGVLMLPEPRFMHTANVDELKRTNKQLKKQIMIMKVVRSDDKMSYLLTQLQSQHEIGNGSESDGGGDDEPGDDKDAVSMSTAKTTADLKQQLYLKMKSDLQAQAADPIMWDVLKKKLEKSSASANSRKVHDAHQDK
ncbi:hypothetical protein Tco_0446002 [Tanacetum coccineum]